MRRLCLGLPERNPLVQYYKIAKDDIREARAEAEKAERAKQRFEAKQARFEREKAAREARHAEAAAQRRQAMTTAGAKIRSPPPWPASKAKQETAQVAVSEPAPDNEAMIAAREARKQEAIAVVPPKPPMARAMGWLTPRHWGSNIPRQSWIPRRPPSPPPWHGPRPRKPPWRKGHADGRG